MIPRLAFLVLLFLLVQLPAPANFRIGACTANCVIEASKPFTASVDAIPNFNCEFCGYQLVEVGVGAYQTIPASTVTGPVVNFNISLTSGKHELRVDAYNHTPGQTATQSSTNTMIVDAQGSVVISEPPPPPPPPPTDPPPTTPPSSTDPPLYANTPFSIEAFHDGLKATGYRLFDNGQLIAELPVSAMSLPTIKFPFPAGAAAGVHRFQMSAISATEEAISDILEVTILAPDPTKARPTTPSNPRILKAPTACH